MDGTANNCITKDYSTGHCGWEIFNPTNHLKIAYWWFKKQETQLLINVSDIAVFFSRWSHFCTENIAINVHKIEHKCHMRKGFTNSTSSRWNADTSELTSSWPSRFSKVKLILSSPGFFLRPLRAGLRRLTYRLLQGRSRLPAPLVLSPSVSFLTKQLDRQWSEIFPGVPV